jgi:sugar lactone lactonase YvrE
MNFKVISLNKNILGEGPYYDSRYDRISWVDIVGQALYMMDKNGIKKVEFEEKISAAIPIKNQNGYMVCGERNLFLYIDDKIIKYKNIEHLMKKGQRCNDAKADRLGRLWFTTITDDEHYKPGGNLYLLEKGNIRLMEEDVMLANGMAFSHDDQFFYFVDSIKKEIYSYSFDLKKGIISNKRVLFTTDGTPDGMSIDQMDHLFVAIWGGKRIEVRDSKNGELIENISLPTRLITSVTFKEKDIIVTSASLSEKDEYAGYIFLLKTNYRGKEEYYIDLNEV